MPKKKKPWVKFLLLAFILAFVFGLFFLSPNITGNTIWGLDKAGANIYGIGFVLLGILGYYFVFRFLGSYL